jgi:hypothetical protein
MAMNVRFRPRVGKNKNSKNRVFGCCQIFSKISAKVKIINHTEQNKMKRVYQRQELKLEQAKAWRRLGNRLELLSKMDSDNVVIF